MELTFNRIDLAAVEAAGSKPADLVLRGHPSEVWYTPWSPLDFQNPPDWRYTKKGDFVHIPLFPYLVNTSPTDAIGYAFQLGVRAMHDLGGKPVRRLHLVLGEPAHQVHDELSGELRWQFFLGFGVVLS